MRKTPALLDRICAEVASGLRLADIARRRGAPSWRQMIRWLDQDPDFRVRYDASRDTRGRFLREAVLESLGAAPGGEDGEEVSGVHTHAPAHARAREEEHVTAAPQPFPVEIGPWLFDYEERTAAHIDALAVRFKAAGEREIEAIAGDVPGGPAQRDAFLLTLRQLWVSAHDETDAGRQQVGPTLPNILMRAGFVHFDVTRSSLDGSLRATPAVVALMPAVARESDPLTSALAEDTTDVLTSGLLAEARRLERSGRHCCSMFRLEPNAYMREALVGHLRQYRSPEPSS